MTAAHPDRLDTDSVEVSATIDAAARYITGQLARQRLRETTDPHGWDLARRLAALADTLTGDSAGTAVWVEANLPRPRPRPPTPSLVRLFPHGGDTALR